MSSIDASGVTDTINSLPFPGQACRALEGYTSNIFTIYTDAQLEKPLAAPSGRQHFVVGNNSTIANQFRCSRADTLQFAGVERPSDNTDFHWASFSGLTRQKHFLDKLAETASPDQKLYKDVAIHSYRSVMDHARMDQPSKDNAVSDFSQILKASSLNLNDDLPAWSEAIRERLTAAYDLIEFDGLAKGPAADHPGWAYLSDKPTKADIQHIYDRCATKYEKVVFDFLGISASARQMWNFEHDILTDLADLSEKFVMANPAQFPAEYARAFPFYQDDSGTESDELENDEEEGYEW
ncbi:uncharacterized protein I303_103382 [Kwoniella dejecticola CBS 10117]|uniref:Uncharacterized protein n=1 Tax=Kwoniella dejecticola CBS 10117 TaxID=1296121 RepID=A0A1A6A6K6_9TREE|nr:uncharacterized protein I303_03405 [Kwoniella dejecticola CBS 10117]OBR85694.1 hypothetical protein I303_03405 [Kwoniella dejecticola CBS 10117]